MTKTKRNRIFKRVLYCMLYNGDIKVLKRKFGCRIVALAKKTIAEKQLPIYQSSPEIYSWFNKVNNEMQSKLTPHIVQSTVNIV